LQWDEFDKDFEPVHLKAIILARGFPKVANNALPLAVDSVTPWKRTGSMFAAAITADYRRQWQDAATEGEQGAVINAVWWLLKDVRFLWYTVARYIKWYLPSLDNHYPSLHAVKPRRDIVELFDPSAPNVDGHGCVLVPPLHLTATLGSPENYSPIQEVRGGGRTTLGARRPTPWLASSATTCRMFQSCATRMGRWASTPSCCR
jgi:hypothetical protein